MRELLYIIGITALLIGGLALSLAIVILPLMWLGAPPWVGLAVWFLMWSSNYARKR